MKVSKKFLFEKKNQKTFSPGGFWVGIGVYVVSRWIAFKRLRRSRLKAIPTQKPPGEKVFAPHPRRGFFQKALLSFTFLSEAA
jgi:hypothetical protein